MDKFSNFYNYCTQGIVAWNISNNFKTTGYAIWRANSDTSTLF